VALAINGHECTHTHTHTEREIEREREREARTHTYTHTHTHTQGTSFANWLDQNHPISRAQGRQQQLQNAQQQKNPQGWYASERERGSGRERKREREIE
jgi:hypothetical protein